jgi:hypothetical protein
MTMVTNLFAIINYISISHIFRDIFIYFITVKVDNLDSSKVLHYIAFVSDLCG